MSFGFHLYKFLVGKLARASLILLQTFYNYLLNIIPSFRREILHELPNIDNGLGLPNWQLVACLAVAWLIIGGVLIRGIKSSGKAAYFLGVFPYVVLLILLLRAVTLPGAMDGIIYFFKPQWRELLNPLVWYAAVTQVFFSLAICFGTLITYASYNNFNRNVYK